MNSFQKNIFVLVKPKSSDEDIYRRELILNVLLIGSVALSGAGLVVHIVNRLILYQTLTLMPLLALTIVFSVFLMLYVMSRIRLRLFAAYILLFVYILAVIYTSYISGVDNPPALLITALIIIMSGILISTNFSIFVTGLITTILVVMGHQQLAGNWAPARYFRIDTLNSADVTLYAVVLLVILLTSWLSNRETERSLRRAQRAESNLKRQNEQLEVTVEERTRELKQTQMEKMVDLYHFAEFGKLATGLFHDFVNPLTSVSLNLEQLGNKNHSQLVDRAIESTKHMERFVEAARRQIQDKEISAYFSADEEIRTVMALLNAKARKAAVQIIFIESPPTELYGNPIKFHKAISNIVANSIDAYGEPREDNDRKIFITQVKGDDQIIITIEDNAGGIEVEHLKYIFEPFFTTKPTSKGMGIGLAITKDFIEKDFKGSITVTSEPQKGTTFTITLPYNNDGPTPP